MRNLVTKLLRTVTEPKRSDRWPAVRRHHLIVEGWCRNCGSTLDLEVHHVIPFHINRDLELDPANLITLCETMGVQCHLESGHLGNWKKSNPNIRKTATFPNPDHTIDSPHGAPGELGPVGVGQAPVGPCGEPGDVAYGDGTICPMCQTVISQGGCRCGQRGTPGIRGPVR